MKKILVTGAKGQLGSEIKALEKEYSNYDFYFVDKEEMPLEDEEKIVAVLNKIKPDFILNAGAYTAVDKAESERETADKINHISVGIIAKWCVENKTKLIHISTDYIFDGKSSVPLKEDNETNPINVYGQSKLDGEKAIEKTGCDAIIIRTSWVYSSYGNNFVKTMLRLMDEREEIKVVNDQIGSPTYAKDLANIIMYIVGSEKWKSGVYNYSNEGEITWFDFAQAIKELANKKCKVIGIASSEFPTPAKRPKYSLLDKSKIKETYDMKIPNWKTSLVSCMNLIKE